MASRVMHLAITEHISKIYPCKDKNRLQLGSVLPDAAVGQNSHLKISLDGGRKKTYDLTAFRAAFLADMRKDDLYLGYYLHLIQDLFFRRFVYGRYHWDPSPPGHVEKLHNDYALLNPYLIQKYTLINSITVPDGFDREPVNRLGRFAICEFLKEMQADFQSCPTGTTFFFTKEMADEFIAYAAKKCEREICSLCGGYIGMQPAFVKDKDMGAQPAVPAPQAHGRYMCCVDERALAWQKK